MSCSCSKSTTALHGYPATITGKWRFVEYFMSPGGGGSWYPASPAGQWLDLKPNGTVSSNMDGFKDATGYELPDSAIIKLLVPSRPGGALRYRYALDTVQQVLLISSLDVICIEGCAMKFNR